IGYWDSPLLEGVVMVLMLLGMTNFVTAYTLFRGKFGAVAKNGEIRLAALLIPAAATILFGGVTAGLYPTLGRQLRVALFESVSALSTTGFTTTDCGSWSGLGWLVLIVLMVIGGGAGSTAGGLKQYRIYALYRGLLWEFRRALLPRNTVTAPDIWVGESCRFLSDADLRQTAGYVFLYLITMLGGTAILAGYGHPLQESLFEFASALGTVGLSAGITTAAAPDGLLWTQTAGMILGRLEFFVVFVGLTRLAGDLATLARSRGPGEQTLD
ncbi:MAG: TrkH family potassium uptake protein, partial [Deltaproteobacteria bacterium]|nr:TrkH family potassium uptake protein [Deltaproteobacteria bacterium]